MGQHPMRSEQIIPGKQDFSHHITGVPPIRRRSLQSQVIISVSAGHLGVGKKRPAPIPLYDLGPNLGKLEGDLPAGEDLRAQDVCTIRAHHLQDRRLAAADRPRDQHALPQIEPVVFRDGFVPEEVGQQFQDRR